MRFGDISHRPSSSSVVHSWPALLLLQTLNPAVSLHSSKKCVYGLLTSRERFQSLEVSFHFQVSAQVNTAIHALAICRDGHAASRTSATTTYDTEVMISQEARERGVIAAPCWLLCTGRRTSVCLIGLRTLLGQSSGCSRARPKLQEKQISIKRKKSASASKNGCSLLYDATGRSLSVWGAASAAWIKFPLSLGAIAVREVSRFIAPFYVSKQAYINATLRLWWVHVLRAYVRLEDSLSAPPNALKAPCTFCTCVTKERTEIGVKPW